MKTKCLLIVLIFVLHTVFGQNASQPISIEDKAFDTYFLNKDNIPSVKGKILNLTKEEISKTNIVYYIVTPLPKLQVTKSCPLNADGSFELTLDYAFPYQQIWISFDTLFYTGVYAHSDLFIELDATIIKTQKDPAFNGPGVKYLGSDGPLNEFTNNHILFERDKRLEISKILQENRALARTNYDAFITTYDSLYSVLNELDNEFIKQNPSNFSWLLINERQSKYFGDLCVVHWGKEMSPELFEKIIAHIPYATSNDGMLFYNCLFTYLNILSAKKSEGSNSPLTPEGRILLTISLLDSLFAPPKADMFKIRLTSSDPQEYKEMIETVLPSIQTTWCKLFINSEYRMTTEKLAAINEILNTSKPIASQNPLGQAHAELPFGAQLYIVDSIKADSLLSAIKNSFHDKALYIDFWATWCRPCIAEMPYSKKLSDSCKDLPIEFVYLCTSEGSDLEKWKSKIAEYKLSGTHIFVEKSIDASLMSIFSATGFPSYIFIDTKGRYIPGSIRRPSELNKEDMVELIGRQ